MFFFKIHFSKKTLPKLKKKGATHPSDITQYICVRHYFFIL